MDNSSRTYKLFTCGLLQDPLTSLPRHHSFVMPSRSKFYDPSKGKYFNPKVDRRVAIVTGGNSGIGWYTVLHLYLHGYIVYIAGRTESKVLKAIEDIKKEANKRIDAYSKEEQEERHLGSLTYVYFDCLDLSTVAACAKNFAKKEEKLDLLINNAGLMGVPYEETKDGYEIQYQVNFVAPFLFTLELLPNLKAAVTNGTPRVIMLLSIGHRASYKYFDPTNKVNCTPNFMYTWVRYGIAKVAEIHFAKKLAKLYPNILSFAVHPGVIIGTELYNHWKNLPVIGGFYKGSLNVFGRVAGVGLEEGSLATLRAAFDPELENENGAYLETGGVIAKPTSVATTKDNIERTWEYNVEELRKKGFLTAFEA